MLKIKIWRFGTDDEFIDSWLEGQALAHHMSKKSVDWFHWKFEQSPYGRSILACAFDENIVAGCVAYGLGVMKYQGREFKCALSYETFVRPDYQGHGLFKKLIKLAEEQAKLVGIDFLYNYPNSNSLTGFLHMGWTCRNDKQKFRLLLARPLNSLYHIKDIRKSFAPNKENLRSIQKINIKDIRTDKTSDDIILPVWTTDYLKWRFFSFPNREYHIINNDKFFTISMVGFRGKLKSVHLLYAISKDEENDVSNYTNTIVKTLKNDLHPDLISYASTVEDPMVSKLRGFISVPSHANFCYKIINENLKINNFKIILPSINAHTY